MRAAAALLIVALLAGCTSAPAPKDPVLCDAPSWDVTKSLLIRPRGDGSVDPTLESDLLKVFWDRPGNFSLAPWNETGTDYTLQAQMSTSGFGNASHGLMHVRFPAFEARDEVFLGFGWLEQVETPSCRRTVPLQWGMHAGTYEGTRPAPGKGTHVLTAGFLEDGRLFYTNMAEVDASGAPRVDWYEWSGADPLPVYVYDQDRSEQPPHWKAPSRLAPPNPGSPALQTAEGEAGVGYFTTIKGFNEALKTMSTTTQRVVRIAPADAYTLPGYEEHPLYGEALVFVIDVVDVVDAPCPATLPDCPSVPGL